LEGEPKLEREARGEEENDEPRRDHGSSDSSGRDFREVESDTVGADCESRKGRRGKDGRGGEKGRTTRRIKSAKAFKMDEER